ncbi:phage terminase large subunit family protein [Paenibacillus tyrfis]|uniref:Terminase n=1 Tax=Paenibacillus tyrfis TaxID=1501230 RepID=A0A081NV46_9BACL|nr:phage terminase large subunit family protein [Paenibacillus tyrfis]KEQ22319.1 terminase [Paenibacillus tyrfis]
MKTKTRNLFRRIVRAVAPPPKLTISEWADQFRRLSSETAAEPGQWRTDRAPYQREPMDSITDPRIEKVVLMWSSQVGKSEIINNTIGYFIDIDPGPLLMIQPTIDIAQDYSKRRISPMIKDTEVLSQKVADSKTRDLNNTILMKVFPGGFLAMAGANSPAGLASRPIRILLCDEVDRYPDSAGSEGDPISLGEKRTVTFWNRKKLFVSTPTIKGASRIEQEYEMGTQEKWSIECPSCGAYHPIVLRDIRFDHEVHETGGRKIYQVYDIWWRCPSCFQDFDEYTMKRQPAKWIAENPVALENRVRSFWLNAFVSPWYSWKQIIQEFLESKNDPEKLKVFMNTVLGESWEDRGEQMEEDVLLKRREDYGPTELPDGVLLLTAGVDTQDDRLEYEIVGWGHGHESWGIEYGVIIGKPDDSKTWQQLDDVLDKVYRFEDGKGLKVACSCIDSGGHFTTEVYKYSKRNEHRRMIAIKGQGGPGIPLIHKISRNNKENAIVVILGVDDGKSSIYSAVKVKEPGPKYCHFPIGDSRGYDRFYFQGLLSEKLVPRKKNGVTRYSWEKISSSARNEALDTRNYATAAREMLKPNYDALERRLKGTAALPAVPSKKLTAAKGLVKKSDVW